MPWGWGSASIDRQPHGMGALSRNGSKLSWQMLLALVLVRRLVSFPKPPHRLADPTLAPSRKGRFPGGTTTTPTISPMECRSHHVVNGSPLCSEASRSPITPTRSQHHQNILRGPAGPAPSPSPLPLLSAPDTQAPSHSSQHARPVAAPGPLHRLFALPRMLPHGSLPQLHHDLTHWSLESAFPLCKREKRCN